MKSTNEVKVRNYHLDQFKHVNNARYLEFLEEGRWLYSENNKLIDVYEKNGISHVAVNININYRKSAKAGDLLLIETDVKEKSKRSVTMQQKVFVKRTGELIADATVTNVFLDAETGAIITTDALSVFWPDLSALADSKPPIKKI
jgi:thioesterase III